MILELFYGNFQVWLLNHKPHRDLKLEKKSRVAGHAINSRWGQIAGNALKVSATRLNSLAGRTIALQNSVAIIDDYYPKATSGFRLAEFDALQAADTRIEVVTTQDNSRDQLVHLPPLPDSKQTERRIRYISSVTRVGPALAYYGVFLSNARRIAILASANKVPFSFTLYPGGGFALMDPRSRLILSDIVRSPWLRRIVVTQPAVHDYLSQEFPGIRDHIDYIFGIPTWSAIAPTDRRSDSQIQFPKRCMRVVFVAHRYHSSGRDKGIDAALDSVAILKSRGIPCCWYFVGDWKEISCLHTGTGNVTFTGVLNPPELAQLLQRCDVAVFPNRAGVHGPGHFDGFPLTAAVEAALNGCAIVSTNPYGQETPIKAGRDYFEIKASAVSIADQLEELALDPEKLIAARRRHRRQWRHVFSPEKQIAPRLRVIDQLCS